LLSLLDYSTLERECEDRGPMTDDLSVHVNDSSVEVTTWHCLSDVLA
jgi:hypothetical protein